MTTKMMIDPLEGYAEQRKEEERLYLDDLLLLNDISEIKISRLLKISVTENKRKETMTKKIHQYITNKQDECFCKLEATGDSRGKILRKALDKYFKL